MQMGTRREHQETKEPPADVSRLPHFPQPLPPFQLIMAEVAPRLGRGRTASTISAAHPGDGGRVAPSWAAAAAAAEGTIITVMSLRDRCGSELLIF